VETFNLPKLVQNIVIEPFPQGDQIRRFFAQWATVCFGQFVPKIQKYIHM
jgi:hypothetical protein